MDKVTCSSSDSIFLINAWYISCGQDGLYIFPRSLNSYNKRFKKILSSLSHIKISNWIPPQDTRKEMVIFLLLQKICASQSLNLSYRHKLCKTDMDLAHCTWNVTEYQTNPQNCVHTLRCSSNSEIIWILHHMLTCITGWYRLLKKDI